MFRVPTNGQFGISSRVFEWNADLIREAAENIALYKRIRRVIMGADAYHLAASPSHDDPSGWCAIQYVSPDRKSSVLLAYRLGKSATTGLLKLHGLDPSRTYQLCVDRKHIREARGEDLSVAGLPVHLDSESRAEIIELREPQ